MTYPISMRTFRDMLLAFPDLASKFSDMAETSGADVLDQIMDVVMSDERVLRCLETREPDYEGSNYEMAYSRYRGRIFVSIGEND